MTKSKRMYFEKLDIELKKVEAVAEVEAEEAEVEVAEYLFGSDRVIRFPIILRNNFRNRKIKNYFFPFSATSTLQKKEVFLLVCKETHTDRRNPIDLRAFVIRLGLKQLLRSRAFFSLAS